MQAQEIPGTASLHALVAELSAHGFENVAAAADGARVVVTYENRRYRFEMRALQEVVQRAVPHLGAAASLTLLPQQRGIPAVAVTVPVAAYRAMVAGATSVAAFAEHFEVSLRVASYVRLLQPHRRTNTSFFKFDVVVHPQFAAQFGNYNDPVESQINVAPEVTTSLWKGMRLSGQVIFPIQNELDPQGGYVRPGLVTLNQTLRLPGRTFASATAGYFTQDRYGVDAALLRFFAAGRFAVQAGVGYTGFASFMAGEWTYAGLNRWTPYVRAAYFLPQYNLALQGTYGRYVSRDRGLRVDVRRAFGEVRIGFFGTYTERARNAGFNIVLPLFPGRYTRPGRVRLRPAEVFRWEYRYRGLPEGGRRYDTGNSFDVFWEGLTPAFIRTHAAALDGWR